jgi:diguanylate cyclase (GGDEF)-like protein/PAS domain S-box-containing protein
MRRPLFILLLPAALALLVAVAVLSHRRVEQFRADLDAQARSHLVMQHIERAQTLLLAAGSARRAYRLSHDKADLAQVKASFADCGRELDAVAELPRDETGQAAHISTLRPLVAGLEEVALEGIDLPSWELLDASSRDAQRAYQNHGTDLAKRASGAFDAMRGDEERLLDERARRTNASAAATESVIFYGSSLGVGLVAVFCVSLLVESRRRLQAQAELARSNALVHHVFESANEIIGVKDRAGRFVLINPAGCEALLRRESEILGKDLGELLSNDTGHPIQEMDERLMQSGEKAVTEQTTTVGDLTRTYLTTKAPYRSADGEVVGIISISRDISERKKLEEMLRNQAVRDPLTGLFNRGYLDETLTREIARVVRTSLPLSLVMLDLDHFKRLNDTFGHPAGDDVLRQCARLLMNSVRRDDVACRYGGEELVLILPDMDVERAVERAEHLRAAIGQLAITAGGRSVGAVTASFGVAGFPVHGEGGLALLAAADAALYQAKTRGRDRVVVASQATATGS